MPFAEGKKHPLFTTANQHKTGTPFGVPALCCMNFLHQRELMLLAVKARAEGEDVRRRNGDHLDLGRSIRTKRIVSHCISLPYAILA